MVRASKQEITWSSKVWLNITKPDYPALVCVFFPHYVEAEERVNAGQEEDPFFAVCGAELMVGERGLLVGAQKDVI